MTSSVEYVYWTKSQETGQSKDLEVTESQLSSLFSFFTEDSSVRQGVPECFRFNITKISFFSSTIIIDTTSIISVIIFKRERDQLDGVVGVGHVVAQNPAPPPVHLVFCHIVTSVRLHLLPLALKLVSVSHTPVLGNAKFKDLNF